MKFLNFEKLLPRQQAELKELKQDCDNGAAISAMKESDGWKIVENHFKQQIELYKAEMLMGCKDWENYLDLRAKAFAMNLLLQDIEEFIEKGEAASLEIDKHKDRV